VPALSLAITLPTAPHPTNATLYYEADYDSGRHWLDYLHIIKTGLYFRPGVYPFNPDAYEENYWSSLDGFRHAFVGAIPGAYDLLADPPSTSGYHRPYISAFKRRNPQVAWVYFWKNQPIKADINKMDDLRKVVVITDSLMKGAKPAQCHRVIIVDDVYATGVTAAVMVEKLWAAGLPAKAEITVACPLRVPPSAQKKGTG
jgi:hypothetical protein